MDLKKRYIDNISLRTGGVITQSGVSTYIRDPNTWEDITNNFKFLDKKLEGSKREIHFLDLYNVAKTFTGAEATNNEGEGGEGDNGDNGDNNGDTQNGEKAVIALAAMFNDLIKNTGIVIAVNFITFAGVDYHKGDILLKLNNGQPLKIDAPSSGYYEPTIEKEEETDNYELQWSFKSVDPLKVETIEVAGGVGAVDEKIDSIYSIFSEQGERLAENDYIFDKGGKTITFTGKPPGAYTVSYYLFKESEELNGSWDNNNNVYGHIFINKDSNGDLQPLTGNKTFAIKTVDNVNIQPIVRFFRDDEPIYCDFTLAESGGNYVISDDYPSFINKIVVK